MSDEAALLAAIRDNPDEDTPRLVYADWLDEHATTDPQRARAEFIRLNCEITQLGGEFLAPAYTEDWWRIATRQYELVEQYHQHWLTGFPFPDWLRPNHFERGFPQELDLVGDTCLALPPPHWGREPLLNVCLSGTTAELCKVIESDWLAGIDSLHFVPDVDTDGDEIARALAGAPCASNLRWIYFINQSLSVAGLRVLGESTRFQRLRTLFLGGNFDADGWAAVVNGPIADRLVGLSFTYAAWGSERRPWPEAAAALAESPRLTKLEVLLITRTRLGAEGVRSIVTSPHLGNLRRLTFGQENFDGPTAGALAAINLPKLEHLHITRSELTDEALRLLAASGVLAQLTHLDLTQNPLTAAGMRTLAGAGPLPRLKSLCLDETPIGDDGIVALARSLPFPGLLNLELAKCQIGPKGTKALAEAPWANHLVRLNLTDNAIRKPGVGALTVPGLLTRLLRLDIARSIRTQDLKDALTARFGDGLNL